MSECTRCKRTVFEHAIVLVRTTSVGNLNPKWVCSPNCDTEHKDPLSYALELNEMKAQTLTTH